MALSNQPYLPLYVNDWLSNTKLKSCSASAHGIMINIMLLMHKEGDYGKILLKQKFKQTDKQILNFASQFAKVLPFDLLEIEGGLIELFEEKILVFDENFIICTRMVRDAEISLKRASSGSKGGFTTQSSSKKTPQKASKTFAKAKSEANTEYEYIIESITNYLNSAAKTNFKTDTRETITLITAKLKSGYGEKDFKAVIDVKAGQWLNDSSMKGYLRPATLFGSKFESYLNEAPKTVSNQGAKITPIYEPELPTRKVNPAF